MNMSKKKQPFKRSVKVKPPELGYGFSPSGALPPFRAPEVVVPASPDTHVLIPIELRQAIEENLLQILTALRAAKTGIVRDQKKESPPGL